MNKKAQLEAEIQDLKNELKSLKDTIESLENDRQVNDFVLILILASMYTNQPPLSEDCLVVDEDNACNIALQYLARVALAKLAKRGDKEEEAHLWGYRYIEGELKDFILFRVLHQTTKDAPVSEILGDIKRRLKDTIKLYEQGLQR